ncbi:hypothetical protein [Streptomyces azureus]|nr:hypothetical protein [Streptomyces azureus]
MKALSYHGRHDLRYGDVPDPAVTNPTDATLLRRPAVAAPCRAACAGDQM